MLVQFKADLFFDSGNNEELNNFLPFFRKGKHRFSLKNHVDIIAFENSSWKESLTSSNRNLLEESLVFTNRNANLEITISTEQDDNYFLLDEAYCYLEQTFEILVENIEYEKPFYYKIFKEFDFSGEIISAFNNGWLRFYNGGGSSIKSVIKEKTTRDGTTNIFFTKPLHQYLRMYVIKDSDKEYCIIESDGQIEQQPLPEHFIDRECNKIVPFHILYKREKENYMPDCVYQNFLTDRVKKNYAQAYLSLNNHQKDFLDIERGFLEPKSNPPKVKERASLKPEVYQLYQYISDENYQVLGFGLKYGNLKATFSTEFTNVNKEDLLDRIRHQPLIRSDHDGRERNEFEHIIHEIKFLL